MIARRPGAIRRQSQKIRKLNAQEIKDRLPQNDKEDAGEVAAADGRAHRDPPALLFGMMTGQGQIDRDRARRIDHDKQRQGESPGNRCRICMPAPSGKV